MLHVNFGINSSLPHPGNQELVKRYLQIFKENEKYDAYSIDGDTLKIIKGKGFIKNNESWDNHKNEDDSENELFFEFFQVNSKIPSRHNRWWTVSWEEVKTKQLEIINGCKIKLKETFDYLDLISEE